MSKHTPGPWVVNDFCTENGADVAIWTSHDPHTAKSICECHFNTVREIQRGEHGCHQLEAEANARLIAAAPELLDALNGLLAECERNGCFQDVSFDHPMVKPAFDAARAAIAKATGAV